MRKINKMNKKALFFTLSLFLLASTVLALSFLIFNYTYKGGLDRTIELSVLDRVSDMSLSIEKSLIKLANLSFRNDILVEENPDGTTNVTIEEMLSRQDETWDDETEENMENFKIFVEEKEKHVNINVEAIKDKELPLVISPHNITYARNWEIGHVRLTVTPQELNFGSYSVIVDGGDIEIKNVNPSLGSAGDFYFSVLVKDNYGFYELNKKYVDPSESHDVKIFFEIGNKVTVTFEDDNKNNELEIWSNAPEEVSITTVIDSLEDLSESVRTDYLDNALIVSFPGFGISKIRPLILQ